MNCPTPRKTPYASRRKALGAMQKANRLWGSEGRFRSAYKCPCKAWHLTSQENSERRGRPPGVEMDPVGVKDFCKQHGLTLKALAFRAGVSPNRFYKALAAGRMGGDDLTRVQEAMVGVLREERRVAV